MVEPSESTVPLPSDAVVASGTLLGGPERRPGFSVEHGVVDGVDAGEGVGAGGGGVAGAGEPAAETDGKLKSSSSGSGAGSGSEASEELPVVRLWDDYGVTLLPTPYDAGTPPPARKKGRRVHVAKAAGDGTASGGSRGAPVGAGSDDSAGGEDDDDETKLMEDMGLPAGFGGRGQQRRKRARAEPHATAKRPRIDRTEADGGPLVDLAEGVLCEAWFEVRGGTGWYPATVVTLSEDDAMVEYLGYCEQHSVPLHWIRSAGPEAQRWFDRIQRSKHDFQASQCPADVMPKYWSQRYRLWDKYDRGIQMDSEGWYSVTPEAIAVYIAERLVSSLSVSRPMLCDAFAGVGGNAAQFVRAGARVTAIDMSPQRLAMARHNCTVYDADRHVEFVLSDCLHVLKPGKFDAIFLAPPWGGPDYLASSHVDIDELVKVPVAGSELLRIALRVCPNVAMMLPRNCDPASLRKGTADHQIRVEELILNNKHKASMLWTGELASA